MEDLKLVQGRPLPFKQSFKLIFGDDSKFWLLPTQPELKINYLEKAYEFEKIESFKKGELADDVFAE